jgi:hypothetical protein
MTEADRVEAKTRLLVSSASEAGAFVTGDGCVSEDIAAKLLGVVPKTGRTNAAAWETRPSSETSTTAESPNG